jgi:hypothetical protein
MDRYLEVRSPLQNGGSLREYNPLLEYVVWDADLVIGKRERVQGNNARIIEQQREKAASSVHY